MANLITQNKYIKTGFHNYNETDKRYSLSIEINEKGTRLYRGFNHYYELENYLLHSTSYKYKNHFEIINDDCKMYIDIDKIEIMSFYLNAFIDEFIRLFNIYYNTFITIDDVLVYHRKETDDIIRSIHLIIKPFKISKADIKDFLHYLTFTSRRKTNMNNLFITDCIDKGIYTKKRTYNLPNNTKIKYIEKDELNQREFIDFKEQSKDAKDYLASYTEDRPLIKTNKPIKGTFKVINVLTRHLLKNAFKKLKGDYKQVEKDKLVINSPLDIFDYIIINMPSKFYYCSKDWKYLTMLMKKYNMTEMQKTIWLNKSIDETNNKWTMEGNETYYNSINIAIVKGGLKIFKAIIEKYINCIIEYGLSNDLIKWINHLTNKDFKSDIENQTGYKQIILKPDSSLNNIDKYIYFTDTGFLKQINNDNTSIILGNSFYDIDLKNLTENEKIKNVIELQNINEIKPSIKKFNENKNKSVLACKAKWGTGKTHIVIRDVIEYSKKPTSRTDGQNRRVVMITENNALNKKFATDFNFISHIENSQIKNTENVACSSESIQKVKINETDILILDEFETLFNHYESDTFKGDAYNKFAVLKDCIIKAHKILILDADLSNDRLDIIKQLRNDDFITYDVKQNNFKDYNFNVYVSKDDFKYNMLNDIENNLKICIASSSKNYNNEIYEELTNKCKNKTILKIDGDAVKISYTSKYHKSKYEGDKLLQLKNQIKNDANTSILFETENEIITYSIKTENRNEVLDDLEAYIIKNGIDILLYTPSIKTGISINETYFNKTYAYGHSKSLSSREFIQMLFRARNLINKEINICFNGIFKPIKPLINKSDVKDYILKPIAILKSLKCFNGDFNATEDDYKLVNTDAFYLNVKITNLKEIYNSQNRYIQDFMTRMIYNHNIPINFIEIYNKDDKDEEKEINETEIINDMIDIPLYTQARYKNTDNAIMEQNWKIKQKHKLFYTNYYFKGITDYYDDYEEHIYNALNINEFYETYNTKPQKEKYYRLKHFLGKTLNNFETETASLLLQEMSELNKKPEEIVANCFILTIIQKLDINLYKLPQKITNKKLTELLNDADNHNIINSYSNEIIKKELKTFADKRQFIKEQLDRIGITIIYENHNTTSQYTNNIIKYENFKCINNNSYTGRLRPLTIRNITIDGIESTISIPNDTKLINPPTKLKKDTKNIFIYKADKKNKTIYDDIRLYKTDKENIFNTYEVKINKATEKLRDSHLWFLSGYDFHIQIWYYREAFKKIHKELITQFLKPIVISNKEYIENSNRLIKIYNANHAID